MNACFYREKTGTEWRLEVERAVAVGEEVLVYYPVARGTCPRCRVRGSWGRHE